MKAGAARKRRAVVEEIEPRILYSADFAPGLVPDATLVADAEQRTVDPGGEFVATAQEAQARRHELVLVENDTPDYQKLVDDILKQAGDGRDIEVVLLDASKDGLQQITDILAARQDLSAVHLISHGADGTVGLGATELNFDTLLQNATQIKGWGMSLTADADILIYGCDVAQQADGKALIDALARLTGADVAASDDLTGTAAQGGNWTLEYRTGWVETPLAISTAEQFSYSGILATYTVTNTNDSGVGSLRQVIQNANANAGADTIAFNIAGGGVKTISVTSQLTITDSVVIDGTTQPGFAGSPLIEIDGQNLGIEGLYLDTGSDGSTIKGLTVNRFMRGIYIAASSNNVIAGNYLGTDASGTVAQGNWTGIFTRTSNNTIGGTSAADRNIISGNSVDGIQISGSAGGSGNVVLGNYIGLDVTGMADLGNTSQGIALYNGATNNIIGGTAAGAANVISGNDGEGVRLINAGTSGNVVQGNLIGTNAAGTAGVGNSRQGVWIDDAAANNTIGGTAAGAANTIAYNTTDGVALSSTAGSGNAVLGNAIFSNGGLGIDLRDDGVTANDGAKTAGQPNLLMDFPVIQSATLSGTTLTVSGYIGIAAGDAEFAGSRVEFFESPEAGGVNGEGQAYLGFLTADANGNFAGALTASGLAVGERITATATDASGNTSEFGVNMTVAASNSMPATNDDIAATPEDNAIIVNVAANDTDTNGDAITVIDVTGPANGSASASGGSVTYTPDADYSGADSFEYLAVDAGAGLAHYWGLAGNATDSVGGADGVLVNGPTTVAGSFGEALSFDETDDRVVVPDLAYANSFSVAMSFKVDDNSGSGYQYLYSHGAFGTNNSLNILIGESGSGGDANKLIFGLHDVNDSTAGLSLNIDIAGLVGDGQWHTLAVTVEGGIGSKFYVDGVLRATHGNGGDALNPTGSVYFGAREDSSATRFYGGALDSVMVFDRTLNAAEVSDLVLESNRASVAVTVNPVNDAPTITNGATVGLSGTDEDTTSSGTTVDSILTAAGWADVDSGALKGIAVTAVSGNGTWQYSTDGIGWTNFGAVSGSAALLLESGSQVRYVPDGQNGESATFSFRAWDQTTGTASTNGSPSTADPGAGGGSSAYSSESASASIVVTSVNDAPVLDNSGAMTLASITEDDTANNGELVSVIIASAGGDRITDVDSGSVEGVAITALVSGNGTWEYSTDAGGSWNAVGAVSNNSALLLRANDRLRLVPDGLNADLGSVTFRAWDQSSGSEGTKVDVSSNGGTTAFSSAIETASITVTAVNDAPTATITPPSYAADEATSLALEGTGLSIADVDAGGASVTATLSVVSGTLTVAAGTTGVMVGGSGSNSVTLTGTLTQINDLLAGNLGATVEYLMSAPVPPATDTLTLSLNDGGNSGSGGAQSGSDTATINITAVNDAPANNVPAAQATPQNTALVFSSGNGNAITVADADAGASLVLVTLTASNGIVTLPSLTGLTVMAGANGSATITVRGDIATLNTRLDGLTFTPTGGYSGPASVSIVTDDQGNTGAGGAQAASNTINITVTPTGSPIAGNDSYTLDEDAALSVASSWWNSSWQYRQQLTFSNATRAENLVDFPVLVAIDTTGFGAGFYAQAQAAGQDLRFVDPNGQELAYQIDSWNPGGTSYVWVKVPQIDASSNTDSIWMYWGNGSAADAQNAPAVWSNGYDGVWHLNQTSTGAAGEFKDSSPSGYNGRGVGSPLPTTAAGVIGNAQLFDGNQNYVQVTNGSNIQFTTSLTLEGWIRPSSFGLADDVDAIVRKGAGNPNNYELVVRNASGTDPRAYLTLDGDDNGAGLSGSTILTAGQWYYVVGTFDGTTASVYVNGVLDGSMAHGAIGVDTRNLFIGGRSGSTDVTDGRVDEVRVAGVSRSANWVNAQYASMTGTFVSNGAVQSKPATVGVLATDTSPTGAPLSAVLVSGPSNAASFTLNADGTFSYTPTADFFGTDTFTYRANDGSTNSNVATVTLTINPINDAPVAAGAATLVAVAEDTVNPAGATVSALFAGNYSDAIDGASATALSGVGIVGNAATAVQGTWQYSAEGSSWNNVPTAALADATALVLPSSYYLRFVPAADYSGTPGSLTVRLSDGSTGAIAFSASGNISAGIGGTGNWSSATVALGTSVTAVNDAPTATITPPTYAAIEQTNLALHGTGLSVADIDAGGAPMTATLSVVSGTLTVTAGATGVSVGGSGSNSVTLTGTITQINNLLAGSLGATATYVINTDVPPVSDTLTLSVDDGGNTGGGALTASDNATISITPVNDAPVVTAGAVTAYTENAAAVVIDNSITISDADDTQVTGATVTISAGLTAGDVLGFVDTATITGVYNAGTGVLTLTGTDTLAAYQAALRSVTYNSTSEDPTATSASRTIDWQVTDANSDGTGAQSSAVVTSTVNLTALADAPVVTAGAVTAYTENAAAVVIDNTITVADADDTQIASATVTISAGLTAGDVLGFVDTATITGVYNAGTAVLTLTGTDTLAAYQAALRSVTYSSTSEDPTALSASRTIDWQVTDANSDGTGAQSSAVVTSTVNLTALADVSVVTAGATTGYTENAAAVVIDNSITINDADDTQITGATVTISAGLTAGDVLGFVDTGTITGVYNAGTGVLTLSGTDTLAAYQAALRSVTYSSTSEDPTALSASRTLDWQVTDANSDGLGAQSSAVVSSTVNLTALADAPVVTAGAVTAYTENAAAVVVDNSITINDADDTQIAGATVSISAGLSAGDVLGFVDTGTITGVYNAGTGVLTLSGTDTLAAYQVALRSVTYSSTSEDPTALSASRTLDWQVTDADSDGAGAASSAVVSSTVNLTALADAPVVTAGATTAYTENAAAVVIDNTITVNDADDTHIGGATVTISAGLTAGDVLAFVNTASISGVYNAGTGVLTLTGSDTLVNYEAALRSVTYSSTSDDPTAASASRTLAWQVTDANSDGAGAASSVAVTSVLNVTAVNDAPVLIANRLTLNQGDSVVLGAANMSAGDVDNLAAGLSFIVSNLSFGRFEYVASPGVAITVFTQAEVAAGQVRFVHDGSGNAPVYELSVDDGLLIDGPYAASISFNPTPLVVSPPPSPPPVLNDLPPPAPPPAVEPPTEEPEAPVQSGDSGALQGGFSPGRIEVAGPVVQLNDFEGVLAGSGYQPVATLNTFQAAPRIDPTLQLLAAAPANLQYLPSVPVDWTAHSAFPEEGEEAQQDAIDVLLEQVQLGGMALSVGVVWWASRISGLLGSLLASAPAWRHIDPLPVVGRDEDEEKKWYDANDRDADANELAIDNVFDGAHTGGSASHDQG